jgi:D-glycero-alpha-D-manno-heptose-7-phosphate kinase
MIIIRSPLRITFGGGGTDIPSYALQHGGFCISAAISKYIYVAINHTFKPGIILKYSDTETPQRAEAIKHPIFREALQEINLQTPQVEIISIADVPSDGAGLGNSGAFTVALLKALYSYKNIPVSPEYIAEKACHINMEKLGKVQGKQDEYISALGGITCLEFNRDGTVNHYPLKIAHKTMVELEENLMLFYTGFGHDTQSILSYQDTKTKENDADIIHNLHELKDMGFIAKQALEEGNTIYFAGLLNAQWENKEKRMPEKNEALYNLHYDLLDHGAIGSKIIGSGGGGFVMIYAGNKALVRNYMQTKGLEELRFTFDFDGCKRLI